MGYLICLIIGFFIGVILTCILLSKKNLEHYNNIKSEVEDRMNNAVNTYKASYNHVMENMGYGEETAEKDEDSNITETDD